MGMFMSLTNGKAPTYVEQRKERVSKLNVYIHKNEKTSKHDGLYRCTVE